MGCTGSLFKKAPKEDDAQASAEGSDEAAKSDNASAKKSAKGGKSAKGKGKEKKEEAAPEEVKSTANGKTGANSAKVRPMTPTPPPANNRKLDCSTENSWLNEWTYTSFSEAVPKPVAFDVGLDEQDSGAEATEPDENTVTSDGSRLRLPRKLPKLSSLTGRKDSIGESGNTTITSEEIQDKQRKADAKRQEILEEKKQKARKFVAKFGNNSKSASVASSQEEDEDDEEELSGSQLSGGGMNGLDSGLGLDKYGLDGEGKTDDERTATAIAEGDYRSNRIDTASSAPVVVQAEGEWEGLLQIDHFRMYTQPSSYGLHWGLAFNTEHTSFLALCQLEIDLICSY